MTTRRDDTPNDVTEAFSTPSETSLIDWTPELWHDVNFEFTLDGEGTVSNDDTNVDTKETVHSIRISIQDLIDILSCSSSETEENVPVTSLLYCPKQSPPPQQQAHVKQEEQALAPLPATCTAMDMEQGKKSVKCVCSSLGVHLSRGRERSSQPTYRRRRLNYCYTCTIDDCGKQFTRAYNLKIHELTHNRERARPFACDICDKTFVRVHDLTRHATTHLNGKAYMCRCGVGFTRSDALTRHIRNAKMSGCGYKGL